MHIGQSHPRRQPASPTEQLLARPIEQRAREHKYRCAQSIVFGLPVLFLQYFGQQLGGPEAARWVAILQALLAGWVMYVGAAGMLFESLVRLWRRHATLELIVAGAAMGMYLWSLISAMGIFTTGRPWYGPLLFHASVALVGAWTGLRWYQLQRAVARLPQPAADS